MTYQEMVKVLKGSAEEQKQLFDTLINKAINESLDDGELVIVEALKKQLFSGKVDSKIVQMSANVYGISGVKL